MRKTMIRVMILLLCAVMVLGLIMPALASETDGTQPEGKFSEIHTVEDLLAMAQDPGGNYRLMTDLDLTGVEWKPVDFTGIFDGGGHALLNLTLSQPGEEKEIAYDGNRKSYECSYVGFFGTLRDAQVYDLKLMGVNGVVETDEPCFMGGLAGYCNGSTVTNCKVYGNLELRAHNQIFGLGGVLGYGIGAVKNCDVDVVLVCTDTGRETLDEQFLGGVYSTGYIDVTDTAVKISGFVSEYGYSHNGGIVGLYMQHPLGTGKRGYVTGNSVSGSIKFFECNNDRRAYCAPFAGENLAVSYDMYGNLQYFKRLEIREYDREIRPCMCEEPDIDEYQVASRCDKDRYGHTVTECLSCAHMEKHTYTLMEHPVTNWKIVEEPTLKVEGLSEGICDQCGITVERIEPVLVPETEPTQATLPAAVIAEQNARAQEAAREAAQETEAVQGKISILFFVLAGATVLLTVLIAWVAFEIRREKKAKEATSEDDADRPESSDPS